MAAIYIGDYQKATPEQQAFMYASGYRWTSGYVISETQQPGMTPLAPPASYKPGETETELSQRAATQREQEAQTSLELSQSRQLARQSFGGTFTESSLAMAQAPIGTDVSREIREMPIEQQEIQAKIQYLQSPTAQYGSETEFRSAVAGVERFAPEGVEFKGTIVSTPSTQPIPTPFEVGGVKYGGLLESRQQPLPSTPIDYSRTHVSELTTFPLYKGAAFVSEKLQAGLEFGIGLQPLPEPIKEVQRGAGSLITGMPEFIASGISGWEYAAREPGVFRTDIVPAVKMFGVGLVEQTKERPFFTGGQATGFLLMMRGGRVRQPKLIESSKIEPFKSPARELLPQRPIGTEGLELLKIPERPGVSKPIVLEGVKGIRESSIIPEQYRVALEKGATPFAERGVMGLQFGSKGYRPTGSVKPENIFTTGEFKRFFKEEKAVSYVPTFERLKAEPQIKPRVKVITAEKTYVLPSLRNLQVVKTAPKTSFKIAVLPKISTRSAVMTDILVQTRPKIFTQTMTRTAIKTKISLKPSTRTSVLPSTRTRVSIVPAIQFKTSLKPFTQTQTKTSIRTQTMTKFDVTKITKTKTKDIFKNGKIKISYKKSAFKFPELTRVASPKQILKGFGL